MTRWCLFCEAEGQGREKGGRSRSSKDGFPERGEGEGTGKAKGENYCLVFFFGRVMLCQAACRGAWRGVTGVTVWRVWFRGGAPPLSPACALAASLVPFVSLLSFSLRCGVRVARA